MVLIGQAIDEVQEMYSRGVKSKDSRLTSRRIYSALIKARSTVIRQQVNKNQMISNWVFQILPCVELEKAPIHECPCIPTNGMLILRTKFKLPTPITGLDNMLIKSVSTVDSATRLDATTYEEVKYEGGNKYTSNKPGWYPSNRRGYVTHRKELKAVTFNGLFDNPIEVYTFPSICEDCNDCKCKDYMEIEFPIDENMLGVISQMAYNELVIEFGQMKQDRNNNASDDIEGGGQMVHQPNNVNTEE